MAASNKRAASVSDEGLTQLLEQTMYARALKGLEESLPQILHTAVRDGILAAAQNVPDRKPAQTAPVTQSAETRAKEVSRPASGGRCAQVWDELDKVAAKKGKVPTLQEVQKLAERKSWNSNTARIQFYRWRSATAQSQTSA